MTNNLNLLPGLKTKPYVYSDMHALLAQDAACSEGANIGNDGINLTITCLSMNRIALTEKLVASISNYIPYFKGEILIVDNGSSHEELNILRELQNKYKLKITIVELGENFGVSGGRNESLKYIKTKWALFLDNDIYFINNPLPRLQKDISHMGCHFINMPLLEPDGKTLFAKGGNLFLDIQSDAVHVGAGSACAQEIVTQYDDEGFLTTFLFGGASVINIDTLKNIGCYDNNMFIGFEDIDLSIRIFQAGMKIGTCGAISLIHDHPKPDSAEDKSYEKLRFTRNILKQSADYLEKKHGMIFWSAPVDSWLEEKQKTFEIESMPLSSGNPSTNCSVNTNEIINKPKIALIIDAENWAFANIARQIAHNLSDSFSFTIIPTEVIDNISQVLMMTKDYDITHFFWRESLRMIYDSYYVNYNKNLGLSESEYKEKFLDGRIITSSVYDHLFLEKESIALRERFYNELITAYTVSSSKLFDIYSEIDCYPAPMLTAEDGVDLELFYPKNLDRFDALESRSLRIGWAGNSKWAGELEDFKGYHSLLKPAVEILQNEGLNIDLVLADRQQGFIPHKEMVHYYNQIDLYVCPSKIEGTPNPILESMACGVPVITTDVGIVNDAFGELQKKWILSERNLQILTEKLREFYLQRGKIAKELSQENLSRIRSWDWKLKTNNFKIFFDSLLDAQKVNLKR